jgi:ribosomal 30S subunit maturation factor RimM
MAKQHVVVEDIDKMMREDLAVYEAGGEKIGSVRDHSNDAGYLLVETGPIARKELYVPYNAIQSIDPREIFLSLGKAALLGDYSAPPRAAIVVEGDIASTRVSSGYDAGTAEINRVDLQMVRRDLARGMTVFATGNTKLGEVDGIDPQTGFMVVKEQLPSRNRLFIPFAFIVSIDRQVGEVYLAISRDVLLKDHAELPEGTVLHVDDVRLAGVDVIGNGRPTS